MPARAPRRLWDSCIVIGYLAGYPELKPDCPLLIEQAERGEIEIVVSMIAEVESAYLEGYSDQESESSQEPTCLGDGNILIVIAPQAIGGEA